MNNEKLDKLFNEIREEKVETSIQDVNKWIALSAASVGLFGLMSKFKMSFLLTKKIIIMSSLAIVLGVTCTSIFLYSQSNREIETTPILSKSETVSPIKNSPTKPLSIQSFVNPEKRNSINKSTSSTYEKPFDIATIPVHELTNYSEFQNPIPLSTFQNPTITNRQVQDGIAIEERSLKPFTKINVTSAINVYLSQGNTQSVRTEIDERYADRMDTEVVGGELIVKINKGKSINNPKKLAVYITVPNLTEIESDGAVSITGQTPLTFDQLELTISGASSVEIEVTTKTLKMDISGAADIDLTGSVNQLKADFSGACDIKMTNCKVENADIDISGASKAKLNVSKKIRVDASGASHLKYKGNPDPADIKVSGAAKVN